MRAIAAMRAGLVLSVVAMIAPYLARDTLAAHVRHGYPAYSPEEIDTAVTTWLAILTTIGVLAVIGWVTTIWATRLGKAWAPWPARGLFVVGTVVALTALLVKDTSGEVGLAPVLGLIGLLPCVAGLATVLLPADATTSIGRARVRRT
jgi:hypothetical protein